ncbi:MAG: NGG1p interacting factor NIF3 [Candidatus Portnoybacteria bacterium]|nr:NGG1p interacting factor NIF3 [Candidatus Portnoybacteria bacterium]MDD4982782.1 NGG1p interacting factor NIF3 [Candidatus Portnoybacteria bacterium]
MTQQQILELAIKMGTKADLRGVEAVAKYLVRQKKKFEGLSAKKQADFDKERLVNPYMDSGVWNDSGKPVKKAMAGIDVTSGDIMLAKSLGVDTIINHHPLGKGLAMLDGGMHLQADVLALCGVPINIAESLMKVRISEVGRGVHASNSYKTIDAAKLAKVNLMNVHTPADNLVADFLKKIIDKKQPEYVSELVELIAGVDEYKESARRGSPVKIFAGSEDRRAGKIVLTEITGGTEGAKNIYREMANAGIGTVVAMHLSEEHRKNAEEAHLNVVVASHIASDSLGMNLFLDELEKKGIEVISYGGLIRIKRGKK